MKKVRSYLAWPLVLPVFLMVSITAIIPLMTVVNYSFQDIMGPNDKIFVGLDWYREVLRDPDLHMAFVRQLIFSFSALFLQIPLGLLIAYTLPRKGAFLSIAFIILGIPLLIPYNVIGTLWQLLARSDIGPLGIFLQYMGLDFNYAGNSLHAWFTVLLMDFWHWTPLVVLLLYSGLRSVPENFYRAATIDGATKWDIFRYVDLPYLKKVLITAILLRFMDSFMIYAEPFVLTGGGPGSSTTFLGQYLTRLAIGQFDLGPASAFSLIYFLFNLLFSFVFFQFVTRNEEKIG